MQWLRAGQREAGTDHLLPTSLNVNVYRYQCLIHLVVRVARDQPVAQTLQNKGLFNRN